jgi:hypothetical protein
MIGGFLLIRRLRSDATDAKYLGLLALLVLMLLLGSLYFLYYVGAPGLDAIGGERLLSYTMIPTFVLSGFALYHLVARFGHGLRVAAAVLCTIMLAAVLSMLALYDSPYRLRPNLQITQMDMTGIGWLVETKNRSLGTAYILTSVDRFGDALLGMNKAEQREDTSPDASQTADHFGYGDYATLGEQYLDDTYLAIIASDAIVYDTVWKEVGRFSQDDFAQLQEDGTVMKLYVNGELDVYLIRGLGVAGSPGDGE